MSATIGEEVVTDIHHWSDRLFSIKTTRSPGFRFKNGHFTLIGLEQDGKPLMRAYSIASANHEDELEFFSIKVPNGPLTSQLQHIQVGDTLKVGRKTTGTLINDELLPGKRLYLISTGTGLAPFLSIIKDPEIYAAYDKVILTHGVRFIRDLAYTEMITKTLPTHEYLGEMVREKLLYYPTVTREPFKTNGRLTELMASGQLTRDLDLPPLSIAEDRFMICGSTAMIKDVCDLLNLRGFKPSRQSNPGHYVIERAFVER